MLVILLNYEIKILILSMQVPPYVYAPSSLCYNYKFVLLLLIINKRCLGVYMLPR